MLNWEGRQMDAWSRSRQPGGERAEGGERALLTKRARVAAERLAVLAQQQVGASERRRAAWDLIAQSFLKGAVHGAVVFLGSRVADAWEHARAVPFQRQAGAQSTKHQNLFGARLADVGKLL